MDQPILEVQGVNFTYGDLCVLKDIRFSMVEGEVISFLGPSGCGKTTLLNLVAGFLRPGPPGGRILLDGREIRGPGADRAMVFQRPALFEWYTVRQNVEFSLVCRRVPETERRKVSERLISLVGLRDFENHYPYQLSGGMQQRVGVARVLAANPRIMLMDEPFAAVDIQTRERLQEELLKIRAVQPCAVIFVTHSIEEAIFISDRIMVFTGRPGRIKSTYQVSLPAPRWNDMNRLHEDFLGLRGLLYKDLRDEDGPAAES